MTVFLDNTIYTNYALSKITRNLGGSYENFNFLKIKIGSGDNTLSMDKNDLTHPLYSLRIKDVYFENGAVIIKCEIPPELAEVPITEIGLFDTVLGVEHLFSYSKIEIVKPSDLNYELTIVINLGPKSIKFPGINVFKINEVKYVSKQTINSLRDMLINIETNLERTIYGNAKELGYNIDEVAFENQLEVESVLKECTYSNLYYSLYNKYGKELTDLYFFGSPNYLSYDLINFANDKSYLSNYLGLFESTNDSITFHDGPVILAWTMKINDTIKDSTVFNKKDMNYLYFSVDLEYNDELYKIESIDGYEPFYNYSKYNELVITLYGDFGTYKIKYILDRFKMGNYTGRDLPYILTFNGDFVNPEFHLYIDGVEPKRVDEPLVDEDTEKQYNRQESDLYNKIIYGDLSVLVDMPDYSKRCPLKNYLLDYGTGEKYGYDNAMGTKVLLALKKQATKHDVAFLSSVLRSLGELN